VLNTMGALSTAYACNAPVLCITGQIPSPHIGGGLGFLHEIPDQDRALASVSKWQGRITSPTHAPAVVREAFLQLNSGRRRPVVIEIPPDVSAARAASPPVTRPAPKTNELEPDPDAMRAPQRCSGAPAIRPSLLAAGCSAPKPNCALWPRCCRRR